MAAPQIKNINDIIPTMPDVSKILNSKLRYEAAQKQPAIDRDIWNKKHFNQRPEISEYQSRSK